MKRFIIMGIVTLVLAILILVLPIKQKYLGIYEEHMSLEHAASEDTYWDLSLDNNNISIADNGINSNTYYWNFTPESNGNVTLTFTNKNKSDDSIITTVKYAFKIEDKKIMWTGGEATGLTDFANPY